MIKKLAFLTLVAVPLVAMIENNENRKCVQGEFILINLIGGKTIKLFVIETLGEKNSSPEPDKLRENNKNKNTSVVKNNLNRPVMLENAYTYTILALLLYLGNRHHPLFLTPALALFFWMIMARVNI